MCSPTVQYISMNKRNIFEGPDIFYYFSAILKESFSNFEKHSGAIGIYSSAIEPIGNKESRKEIF